MKKKVPYISLFFICLFVLSSIFASYITPYTPEQQNPDEMLILPFSLSHPLGTDELGRDMLSRLLYGGRLTFSIAFFSSLLAVFLGSAIGILSGFTGGIVDSFFMRTVDFFYSIPDLLLIVLLTVIFGRSPEAIIISLAIISWATVARMVRNEVLSLKGSDFISSCKAMGGTDIRIISFHIIPNIFGAILVVLSLRIPVAIIAESSLSFLGLGLNPPASSWGVLCQAGYRAIGFYWHLIFPPATAIFITVYSLNRISDFFSERFLR